MNQLTQKKCVPCEGGVEPLPLSAAKAMLSELKGWQLVNGKMIRQELIMKDFMAALKFLNAVAQIAESQGHHPDLHLTRYRNLAIELYTHAIGGLSENDFIVAAKIDQLPRELKA